jgi:hypothetical protein
MHYAQNFVPGLPVDWATVALLGLFAVLISELGGVRLII